MDAPHTTSLDRRRRYERLRRYRLLRRQKAPAPASGLEVDAEDASYWESARLPLSSLLFIAPLVLVYEMAVLGLGDGALASARTGADAWMQQALGWAGLDWPGVSAAILVACLLAWHLASAARPRIRPGLPVMMGVESVVLAVGLIGSSRLVELLLEHLEQRPVLLQAATMPAAGDLVGYLGAGIYEEALFRLALIPLLYRLLKGIQAPEIAAGTLAVTGSALCFALAHHMGPAADPFSWYVFSFRWLAGIYFAGIFLVRGFGIAVGTHAAYDVLVGTLG